MLSFSFYNPTKIHFGKDTIRQLGLELTAAKIEKVLLIAGGGSIKENGVYEQVSASLMKQDIVWKEGWGVQPNPTLNKVRELIEIAREEEAQALVAVGGGSVIDTAKAVAAGFYLNDVWNAYTGKEVLEKALPVFAVLTLSATGSEMNGNSVITNMEEKKKWALRSPLLNPRVSIIDPSVQSSLPFNQTVNGALDAMAHILEYYFASAEAVTTLSINEALLRNIVEMTDRLHQKKDDETARENLAWCATMALNGISGLGMKGGDWACHQIEHSISALYPRIAHGEGLGVLFPTWIEYINDRNPALFTRWAKNVWGAPTPSEAIKKFRNKIEEWGSAGCLRDLGIQEQDLPAITENVLLLKNVGGIYNLERNDIEHLLMLAW